MVEICQLTIRGQLPSLAQATMDSAAKALRDIKRDEYTDAFIRSNKRLGVKEAGRDCFRLFAAEGSGNDTEILIESIALCPESGGVTIHENEGDIVLDVGRELTLVFSGRDASGLLIAAAKLLQRRLCDDPQLAGVSEYLRPVTTTQDQ